VNNMRRARTRIMAELAPDRFISPATGQRV
jgi:hypothetical protein